MRRTKGQAQATRDNLIEVASRLIEIHGLSHTTLEDIATCAGVTRGAIYWHFKNKDGLVEAVMNDGFRLIEETILPRHHAPVASSMDGLAKHTEHLFRCIETSEQIRRFLNIVVFKVEYTDAYVAVHKRALLLRDRFITAISQSNAAKVLPDGDRLAFAMGLYAIVVGLVRNWILSPSAFPLAEVGIRAVNAYSIGMRKHMPIGRHRGNSRAPH